MRLLITFFKRLLNPLKKRKLIKADSSDKRPVVRNLDKTLNESPEILEKKETKNRADFYNNAMVPKFFLACILSILSDSQWKIFGLVQK
jgi:hypothetical protein